MVGAGVSVEMGECESRTEDVVQKSGLRGPDFNQQSTKGKTLKVLYNENERNKQEREEEREEFY